MKKIIKGALRKFFPEDPGKKKARQLQKYFLTGQKPWSPGYEIHKKSEIEKSLSASFLETFATSGLPEKYGYRLDERVVEYPWIFSHLSANRGSNVLDAGSTFNFPFIVEHPKLGGKNLFIQTFYPEEYCFWKKRVSYVFGDLRELPYRNGFFDEIICQSTLEHIDMDNSVYGYENERDKKKAEKSYEYLLVINELIRVLKPGGRVLLTFPFGQFENQGFFQQFDSEMLNRMLEPIRAAAARTAVTFYQYTPAGWIKSDERSCSDAVSYNPQTKAGDLGDGAAHSRAICCVLMDKK